MDAGRHYDPAQAWIEMVFGCKKRFLNIVVRNLVAHDVKQSHNYIESLGKTNGTNICNSELDTFYIQCIRFFFH